MRLLELLARRAQVDPSRRALVFEERGESFGQLWDRSLELDLEQLGLRQGEVVATLLPARPELLELLFACAARGMILCPLNYRLSPQEIKALLNHSGARALFVDSEFSQLVPPGIRTVEVPREYARLLGKPRPPRAEDHEDLTLMYTSGTTGRPKGVLMTQRAAACYALSRMIDLGLGFHEVALHCFRYFHFGGLYLGLVNLLRGNTLVLVRQFDPERVLRALALEGVTILGCVPTQALMLAEELSRGRYDTSSVRLVINAGAPLRHRKLLREIFPRAGLGNVYGLTEGGVSYLSPGEAAGADPRCVGRPTFVGAVSIQDEQGQALPPGQVGEIAVQGPHLLRGYHRDPEATQVAFRQGWFLTGDLGTMDEAGRLHLVDRKKDVIITGGENVYSGEVEEVLLQHPAVAEVAVVGVPDPHWGEAVVAAVVPQGPLREEELHALCRQRLAAYKCPKRVVVMQELPHSESGKLLKRVLRERLADT